MENPGTNHKNLKGKRRKRIVGMKDTFRKATGIMMAQLEQRPMVNTKEGIKRFTIAKNMAPGGSRWL